MYCERFRTTLSTLICVSRQEKAKKQSNNSFYLCESIIFCASCPQGNVIKKHTNKKDLDIAKLKKNTVHDILKRKDWSMFKIKRKKLKRKETK